MIRYFNIVAILLFGIASLLVFKSCKNDLEVNADYETYPIIYGIINQFDSVQKIRIQRSFLGDADPKNYASNPDSSYFKDVQVDLVEYSNGVESARYPLQKEFFSDKESGSFFAPDHFLYTCRPPKVPFPGRSSVKYLRENQYDQGGNITNRIEYKLEGTLDGIEISSTTQPIAEYPGDVFLQSSYRTKWNSQKKGAIEFATSGNLTDGLLMKTEIPPRVKLAELFFRFHYKDSLKDGTIDTNSFAVSMGQVVPPNQAENITTNYEFYLSSERFFELVVINVPDFDDSKIAQRKPYYVDFELVMGDSEYYYYRENTLPSDDLNQLKPQYSNIENGYGIFASRWQIKMTDWAIGTQNNIINVDGMEGLLLSKNTQIALHNGFIENKSKGEIIELGTASKRFCIDPVVAGLFNCDPGDDCLCK
jgi:hypothetical protein